MRNATDKKRAAIICAAVIVGLLAILLAVYLVPVLAAMYEGLVVAGILAVYALLIIAVIVGVLFALRERLKEIESGEEDEARKY